MRTQAELPRDPEAEVARLNQWIAELDDRIDTPEGLLREHLTTARSCVLGSMPGEYRLTLEMAREILPLLKQPALEHRIGEFLEHRTAV